MDDLARYAAPASETRLTCGNPNELRPRGKQGCVWTGQELRTGGRSFFALCIFLLRGHTSGARVGWVGDDAVDTPVLPSGEDHHVISHPCFGAVADPLIFRSLAAVAPGLQGPNGDVEVFARFAFVEVFDGYLNRRFVAPETGGWEFGGLQADSLEDGAAPHSFILQIHITSSQALILHYIICRISILDAIIVLVQLFGP